MQKYLVVSYDDDQQQWFWDYVAANTAEDAVAEICERRPYVIAADAASQAQVQEIAVDLQNRTIRQIVDQLKFDTTESAGETGGTKE